VSNAGTLHSKFTAPSSDNIARRDSKNLGFLKCRGMMSLRKHDVTLCPNSFDATHFHSAWKQTPNSQCTVQCSPFKAFFFTYYVFFQAQTVTAALPSVIFHCYYVGITVNNILLLLRVNCYCGTTVSNILVLLRANCYPSTAISNTANSSYHLSLCHSSDLSSCNTLLSQCTLPAYCIFLCLLLS